MLPGSSVQEFDNSIIQQNFTMEISSYVGMFEKGPINEPIFITQDTDFKTIFGRGIDIFYNDWYQVYNYLQYSSGIYVVRCAGEETYNAVSYSLDFAESVNASNQTVKCQTQEEFYSRFYSTQTENGVLFCATTPGEAGNIISVQVINHQDYSNNVSVFGTSAKNMFPYFYSNYCAIVVARNNSVRETFYVTIDSLNANTNNPKSAPFVSQYIYAKFDNFDVYEHNGVYELNYGITQIPNTNEWYESHELLENKESYIIDNVIINQDAINPGIDLCETRGDCLGFMGLPVSQQEILCFDEDTSLPLDGEQSTNIQIWVTESDDIIVEDSSNLRADYDLDRVKELIQVIPESEFLAIFNNIKEQKDGFTNKTKLVNVAGDMAGLKAQASIKTPYTPGAGLVNGEIKNIISTQIRWSDNELTEMYDLGLNYISNKFVMSQRTYTNNTSYSRINVRSLFNKLERNIAHVQRSSVFEFDDIYTLNKAKTSCVQILEDAKSARGIQDYRVVVKAASKGDVIDNPNSIVIEIYVQPTYVAENIILRVYNDGTTSLL